MSLLTTLAYGGTTYILKADNTDHSFARLLTQAPLPAGSESTVGAVFTLDLGMAMEQITINGIVDNVASGSFPSKVNLETACRSWWKYTNIGSSGVLLTLPQLTVDTGQTYAVGIRNASFKRIAGQEDRWEYTLIFIVAGTP